MALPPWRPVPPGFVVVRSGWREPEWRTRAKCKRNKRAESRKVRIELVRDEVAAGIPRLVRDDRRVVLYGRLSEGVAMSATQMSPCDSTHVK